MYLVASVRLSVHPSVRPSVCPSALSRQRAKKSHYQAKVFVCVSNSRADAVDRLLILNGFKILTPVRICVDGWSGTICGGWMGSQKPLRCEDFKSIGNYWMIPKQFVVIVFLCRPWLVYL